MKNYLKTFSLKRKIALAFLSVLLFACVAFFGVGMLSGDTKKADAAVITPNTQVIYHNHARGTDVWTYYDNASQLVNAGANGVVYNLVVKPEVSLTDGTYRYFAVSISPNGDFYWATGNYSKACGRIALLFMINGDSAHNGLFASFYTPAGNGAVDAKLDQRFAIGIWPDVTSVSDYAYYNINIKITYKNSVWDLIINDTLSFNSVWGSSSAFSSKVGTGWKNSDNTTNIAVIDYNMGAGGTNGYSVYFGSHRAITSTEQYYIDREDNRWVTPYSLSANAYATITGGPVILTEHGGYMDFAFNFTAKPYTGAYPVVKIAFSPDSLVYFRDEDGTIGTNGRFYVNVMINGDNGYVYVAPHFRTGESDNWKKLAELPYGGILGIRFKFYATQGGWGFAICDTNETTTYDFTSTFQSKVTQTELMINDCTLNVGAAGYMFVWGSNYASVYWLGATQSNGYDVKSNASAVMEVLSGSPAERVTYYDDAVSHSAGTYLSYTSGFKANFSVTLTSALGSNDHSIQIAFGPDNNVMNAEQTSQSGIGYGHFTVIVTFHHNGNLYGHVYYKNDSGNTWTELHPMDKGKIKEISTTKNSTTTFSISVRKLNAVSVNGDTSTYGLFIDDVLLDSINFNTLFNGSRSPKFVTSTNKNIAITTGHTDGFVNFPGNIYLLSTAAETSAPSITAVNTATICDLSTASSYNTVADSVSGTGTGYYYGATSTTQSQYITFEFTSTYSTSAGIVCYLNTLTSSPTKGGGFTVNSSGFSIGVENNGTFYSVARPSPLTNGTTYKFRLTIAQASTRQMISVCVLSGSTVVYTMEATGTIDMANNYTVYVGGASSSATLNTVTYHRALFLNGSTVVANTRFTTTAVTTPTISDAATYYTGYWFRNNTITAANKIAGNTSTGDTTSKSYTRHDLMTNISGMSSNMGKTDGSLSPKASLWRDSVSGEMSNSKGYLAFMHTIDISLYNTLTSAVSSGKISSFKVYVLFKNAATPTASSYKNRADCTGKIYATGSNVHAFVGYIGISTTYKSTSFRSVLCIEITQLDGTTDSVCSTYDSTNNVKTLSAAANTALTTYAYTLTAAQKAAIANYK